MAPAAFRRALWALVLSGALPAVAAPVTTTHFGRTEYVSLYDVCGRLGLKFVDSGNGRGVTVKNAAHNGSFTAESREMMMDGARVLLGDPAIARGGHFYISRIDYEHRLLALFHPELAVPAPRRPRVIVLDPGHGGADPGTENKRYHAQEKTFTLDVALRLRPLLVAEGWTVALTRIRDVYVPLETRATFATQQGADVFVSIHFDAAPAAGTHGSEIFSFLPLGQRGSDFQTVPPQTQLWPGNRFDNWNAILSHLLYRHLPSRLGTYDHGEKIGNLSVLRNASCPAVLVEPGFLSNDAEVLRVETPAFRQQIAEALAAGLKDYADLLDTLQPRAAPAK
jgi:N-acetylmuramoyl-L-alanine amidase